MDDRATVQPGRSAFETTEVPFHRELISIIMANFNGQDHIRSAIESVLRQTHRNLELIISDDASFDDSSTIVREFMAIDSRVRLISSAASAGPAGARNRALKAALGTWVAIVDSDDMIHPERLSKMLNAALTLKSDLVADDLIFFGDDMTEVPRTLLQDLYLSHPEDIDALNLISGSLHETQNIQLGYLKPLIRRDAIGDLRYNEELRVDEDHDFYLRLLLSGARFTLIPDAFYLYRRHSGSISYRFNVAKLTPMVRTQEALLQNLTGDWKDLSTALSIRIRKHKQQLRYAHFVEALGSESYVKALWLLVRFPRNCALLLNSLKERAQRNSRARHPEEKRMELILCRSGLVSPRDYPGFKVINVPDLPQLGWAPSSASIWTGLAQLACENELHITAIGRAGSFALGLVPRYRSARVVDTHDDLDAIIVQDRATNPTTDIETSVATA